MKKFLLIFCSLMVALSASAALPQLTKSTPLTLTAASEGFSQSENAKSLEDDVWINWSSSSIHEGYAKWRINVVDGGVYSVTLDMKATNTYKFRAVVINPTTGDTISIGRSEKADRGDYSNTALSCGKFNLFGLTAGEYYVAVTDTIQWSSGKLRGITLSYINGATTTAPATLSPDDAYLSPRAWVDKTGAVDSILFTPRGSEGHNLDEWVKWAVEIPEAGYYDFTANTYRASGQKFEITLLNQDESSTLISNDNGGSSIGSGNASISTGKINLEKGIYVLRVRNIYQYAESRLLNAVVTYKGGKAVDVPGTLNIDDVILSDEAWVDKTGAVDSILFTARGSEGHNSINWVKWKVNVATAGAYNFKANVYRHDGSQRYEIKVFNSNESVELISNALEGMSSGAASINTGAVYLATGTYIVKVRNTYDHAKSRLLSVQAEYVGGAVQDMPGTTDISEAWFSYEGTRAAGIIDFPDGSIQDGWVKWNVSFTRAANYKVKVNIDNTFGHNYTVALYRNENDDTPILVTEGGQKSTIGTLELGLMAVPAGNYILKVTNATQYSDAKLLNVQFVYAGGATIDIPTTLQPVDAILSNRAWVDNEGAVDSILFTPRGSEGYNDQEWAKWKIRVADRGLYKFAANVSSSNGQYYKITILNSSESETIEEKDGTGSSLSSGDKSFATDPIVLSAGEYVVKIVNTYNYSKGRVLNIVADRATINIEDTETNVATVIGANNNYIVNAHLTRSFNGGEYNTLCLPFDVSAAELARVFPGAKVKELTSSSLEEDGYALYLNFSDANSLQAGKPYLIMPAEDIADPSFLGVTIDNSFNNVETTNADFTGTFVKQTITGNPNNLFLGAENKLQFSSANITIKGLRAYFTLKVGSGAAPRRARLVMNEEQIATDVELIDGQLPDHFGSKVQKFIENGQLIIVKDGVYYNAFGVRVK